jgi:hypothetical protein
VRQTRDPRIVFTQVSRSSVILLSQLAARALHPAVAPVKSVWTPSPFDPPQQDRATSCFLFVAGCIFPVGARQDRTRSLFAVVRVRCLILTRSSKFEFSAHEKLPLSRSLARASFFLSAAFVVPIGRAPRNACAAPTVDHFRVSLSSAFWPDLLGGNLSWSSLAPGQGSVFSRRAQWPLRPVTCCALAA